MKRSTVDEMLDDVRPDSEAATSKPASEKKQTIIMFSGRAAPGEQEKEMSIADAERLIRYQNARGRRLWVIKEGQPFTENEDGSITAGNTEATSNTTE
jgi:hypothetical protein